MKKLFKKIGAGFAAASGACLMSAAVVAMMGCTDNGGNAANGVSEETSIAENITSLSGLVLRSLTSFDLESLDSAAIESAINGSDLYLKQIRFCVLDSATFDVGDSCSVGTINDSGYEVKVESKGWRYGLLEVDVSDVDESRLLEMGYTEDLLESQRYKMHAIVDAKNPLASNVNVLTAWKYYQVKKLVESGVGVETAMVRAESDVLASIGIFGEYENFGLMDFSGNTKSDLLLMAANYLMNVPSVSEGVVVGQSMRHFVMADEIHSDVFWMFLGLEKPSDEIVDQVERFVTNYFAVDAGLERCEGPNDGQVVQLENYGLSLKCSDGLWGWYVPELEHTVGTMTDSRDGHVYKTTSFTVNGTVQTWMAEDLKFDAPGSKCLVDSLGSCETMGRIYTWFDVVQQDSIDVQDHRGICPDGWRIPTAKDWELLAEYIGDDDHLAVKLMKKESWLGRKLRLINYGNFNVYNRASDVIEFSAVPNVSSMLVGRYANVPGFADADSDYEGTYVEFHSSEKTFHGGNLDYDEAEDGTEPLVMGVRCIKNQ